MTTASDQRFAALLGDQRGNGRPAPALAVTTSDGTLLHARFVPAGQPCRVPEGTRPAEHDLIEFYDPARPASPAGDWAQTAHGTVMWAVFCDDLLSQRRPDGSLVVLGGIAPAQAGALMRWVTEHRSPKQR